MTQPKDRFGGQFSTACLKVWAAVPERGWQTVSENSAVSGIDPGAAKGHLQKLLRAGQLESIADSHPMRFQRRHQLDKDERSYRDRLERTATLLGEIKRVRRVVR